MYRDHGMTFDSAGSWTFDNDTARNVITFGVDNGSSSHAENAKNDVFVVKRRSNLRNFVSPEKKFRNNFSKANKKFCLNFLIMPIIVICLLMEKKSLNIKPTMKMLTFWLGFVPEVYLMDLVLLTLEKYL